MTFRRGRQCTNTSASHTGKTSYDHRQDSMPRNRKVITFSLPPEMDEQVDRGSSRESVEWRGAQKCLNKYEILYQQSMTQEEAHW